MSTCRTASATERRKSPSPAFCSNSISGSLSSVIGPPHGQRGSFATPPYSGVRLTRRIAGFFEEVPAFVGAEQGADVAQGGPERLERARGRLAQERFEL